MDLVILRDFGRDYFWSRFWQSDPGVDDTGTRIAITKPVLVSVGWLSYLRGRQPKPAADSDAAIIHNVALGQPEAAANADAVGIRDFIVGGFGPRERRLGVELGHAGSFRPM